jgi:hypothetical protein
LRIRSGSAPWSRSICAATPSSARATPSRRDVHRLEDACRDALLLPPQAEEDVLGPDVVVADAAGLVLRENDDVPRALGEALEHFRA